MTGTILPPDPTGQQLADALIAHAGETQQNLLALVRRLSSSGPQSWLANLARARRPNPLTVARIEQLLSGRDPAPSTLNRRDFARRARQPAVIAVPAPLADDPRPIAWSREPCPRCAVRGDVGCAHQRPCPPELIPPELVPHAEVAA